MTAIAYRLAEQRDLPFVFGGWLSSFRTAHAAGVIPMDRYGEIYTDAITRILERPRVDVVVAYWPGETVADLVGFLCAEKGGQVPIVHYVYVEKPNRKAGIARALFAAAEIDPEMPFVYTFRTGAALDCRSKTPRAKWNPLQARFDAATEERT